MTTKSPSDLSEKFPEVLLILGTDLAGKDHFTNVLIDAALLSGRKVERRRGAFSASPDHLRSSEGKGLIKLWIEWFFLFSLPIHCRFIPYLVVFLIHRDLRRFRRPSGCSVIVVSHTPIRLLAFALGHMHERIDDIRLPAMVERALQIIVSTTQTRALVLDIDHRIRESRMHERLRRGTVDCFDRYMANDPHRSERIERFLVWISETYLGAVRIENNNISDADILASLLNRK